CIHNFQQTNKELTVEKLRRKLQEDINFQGSLSSLRQIIKDLGFRWMKTEDNRKVLIETSNIRVSDDSVDSDDGEVDIRQKVIADWC
ncbi:Uncharacterized protein OBRU01_21012, partial [Operophtera brumata]